MLNFLLGRFTEPQRELYEALLDVQETLVKSYTHSGVSLNFVYLTMLDLLALRLTEVGLIDKSSSTEQIKAVSPPPPRPLYLLIYEVHTFF